MKLKDIDKQTAEYLQDWLHDAYVDALQNDPSVGIFPNYDMADGFRILQGIVEDETGAVPVDMRVNNANQK